MEKKKNSKQGFTLIELLATVLIMSLLIGIVLFASIGIKKEAEIKLDKVTRQHILSGAKGFALEYRNKVDTWKEKVDENGKVIFCISLNSLLEKGYYKYDDMDNIYNSIDDAKNLYVRTEIDKNNVSKYDIVFREGDGDSEFFELCGYKQFDSSLGDKNAGKVPINNESDTKEIGGLEYEVKQSQDQENGYVVDVNFLAKLGIEEITTSVPVYVAIVLDNSGSMLGVNSANQVDKTNWESARNAAVNLSTIIRRDLSNSYIALVQYNEHPSLVRDFEQKDLSQVTFIEPNGHTNVSGSLDLVSSLYNKVIAENKDDSKFKDAMFYTIILYDGEPTHFSALKNTDNMTTITNSNSAYYENFYDAYHGKKDFNYIYLNKIDETYNKIGYVQTAATYLKNINENSKLITIGYNWLSSSNLLKQISTKDNEFCNNSNYNDYKSTSNTTREYVNDWSVDVGTDSNQINYDFTIDSDYLVSTNSGVNTQSYAYKELDLSSYTSDDKFSVKFYYEIVSSGMFKIDITSTLSPASAFSHAYSCSDGWSDMEYCSSTVGERVTEKILYGGQKYYINLYFYNARYSNSKVKIKQISYTELETDYIYDSNDNGYSGGIVTLFNDPDARLVYGSSTDKYGNLVLSNEGNNTNSYTASYQSIDLTEMSGQYLLKIDVTSKSARGYIGVSTSTIPEDAPAKRYNNFYNISNGEWTFDVDGGDIYYIHYLVSKGELTINDISLTKSDTKLYYETNFDTSASSSCNDNDIVGCLKTSNSDSRLSFAYSNGAIISQNREINGSCAHSYVKLNLNDINDNVLVKFNYTISSEYGDKGGIKISNSPDYPGNYGTIYGNYNSVTSEELTGGKSYYVHFTYCKNDSGQGGNDYFQINGLSIHEMYDSDVTLNFGEKVDYSNYFFTASGSSLSATNDKHNTVSHSYLKIDLSNDEYKNKKFVLNMDADISHNDKGMAVLTSSSDMPYVDYTSGQVFFSSGGKNITKSSGDIRLDGGEIYYLHLIYYKDSYDSYYYNYGNEFIVKNIKIYGEAVSSENSVDLSGFSSPLNNQKIEKEGSNYVFKDIGPYTSAYSYLKLDLSDLPYISGNQKYVLNVRLNLDNSNGLNKIMVTTDPSVPNFDSSTASTINTWTSSLSFNLYSNGIWYIHILSENNGSVDAKNLRINSISLSRETTTTTTTNNWYCYYNSNSASIGGLFKNISTEITKSVENLLAKEVKLTLSVLSSDKNNGISFGIVDADGKIIPKIEKTMKLDSSKDNVFNFHEEYNLILNSSNVSDSCKEKDGDWCVLGGINLFEAKFELIYDGNETKEIPIDNLPTVTIKYKNEEATN